MDSEPRTPSISEDEKDAAPAAATPPATPPPPRAMSRTFSEYDIKSWADECEKDIPPSVVLDSQYSDRHYVDTDEAAVYYISSEEEEEPKSVPQDRKRPEPVAPQRMLSDEELADEATLRAPEPKKPAPQEEEENPGEDVENKRNMYARWMFTWYPEGADYRPQGLPQGVEYMIFQEEICPETGRLHLQGYLRFKDRTRFQAVRKLLDPSMTGIHLQWAKKPELACIRYCSKKKSQKKPPIEFGERNTKAGVQGHRSDLDAVAGALKGGKSYEETVMEFPCEALKFSKGMKEVASVFAQEKWQYTERETLTVIVLWGESDTGKTWRVRAREGKNLYSAEEGRDPWGGYNYQEAVLFDEFAMGQGWPINKMKRLLDRYPVQLDCRYANKWAAWKRVYITSNDPPSSWYMVTPATDKRAFWRRVTHIWQILKRQDAPDYDENKHEVPCKNPPDFLGNN